MNTSFCNTTSPFRTCHTQAGCSNTHDRPARGTQSVRAFILSLTVAGLLLLLSPINASATIFYVKQGAAGNGSSWSLPFGDLQSALQAAAQFGTDGDQIWVAEGTYTPGPNVADRFDYVNRIALVGGFFGTPGTENDPDARNADPATNGTVLSGFLSGAQSDQILELDFDDDDDNLIDGFKITGATNTAVRIIASTVTLSNVLLVDNASTDNGGALLIVQFSTVVVEDSALQDNTAINSGGAILVDKISSLEVRNSQFTSNTCDNNFGGAIFAASSAILSIRDSEFSNNDAGTTMFSNGAGGAIYYDGIGENGALEIRNTAFTGNTTAQAAIGQGGAIVVGGISAAGTAPAILNCTFEDNQGLEGGALYAQADNLQLQNCLFVGNEAPRGGALNAARPIQAVNCVFVGNEAAQDAIVGFIPEGGAIRNGFDGSAFINCTIVSNTSTSANDEGGGYFAANGTDSVLRNCILWNNRAGDPPPASQLELQQLRVGTGAGVVNTVTNNCIEGLSDFIGNNNIDLFPEFVDIAGADTLPGTADDDLRLSEISPCRDVGLNPVVPPDAQDVDENGNTTEATPDRELKLRLLNSPDVAGLASCTAKTVDMGAFEFASDCDGNMVPDYLELDAGTDTNGDGILDVCQDCNNNGILDVDELVGQDCNDNCVPDECECLKGDVNGDGAINGLDIAPFIDVYIANDPICPADIDSDCVLTQEDLDCFILLLLGQPCGTGASGPHGGLDDCNDNGVIDATDVLEGTSPDCNQNFIPDECDIAAATSADVNGNGVPDECEPDCNGNGVPDAWDISEQTSSDCNLNGLPDECEADCNLNDVPDACDVDPADPDGDGQVHADCNQNGIPDSCDLSRAILKSFDCNSNGIPDECDIASCGGDPACGDCNANGVPDACDIATGVSQDGNTNGIPDECEQQMAGGPGSGGEESAMGMPSTTVGAGSDEPEGAPSGGAVVSLDEAWQAYYEWAQAQCWGPGCGDSGAAQYQRHVDKLLELGLPVSGPALGAPAE